MRMLLSVMVVVGLVLGGCASSAEVDASDRPAAQAPQAAEGAQATQDGDEGKTGKVSSAMTEAFMVEESAGGSHDGMCTGGEILMGCSQQACTHGTGLPNSQCPLGYYCWCW